MANEGKDCNFGSVMVSFFLGGLVGAGAALLLAPKSGEETRRQVKVLVDDAKQKIDNYLEEAKSKAATTVEKTVEKGKELLEKEKSVITSAIEAGKEAYQKEKEKLTS